MTDLYITKYALSSGIHVRTQIEIDGGMAIVIEKSALNGRGMYHGKDWHVTKGAALADADRGGLKRLLRLRSKSRSSRH